MPKESEHDASRQIEDLRTARERLGRPIFPDQKSAHKEAVRSIAKSFVKNFDNVFTIQTNIINVVNSCKKEDALITPTIIAIQTCLEMARDVQRKVLLKLMSQERGQSAKVAAELDVVKGFQMVLNTLNLVYNPIAQEKMTDYPDIKLGLAIRKDPKGLTVAKQLVKSWKSPLRT